MKIVSFRSPAGAAVGMVDGDIVLPLLGIPSLRALMLAGPASLEEMPETTGSGLPLSEVQLLAPVPDPSKIIAIGLNYRDHAVEAEMSPPAIPLIFAKFPSAIIGPGADITWDPEYTSQVDYEAELAVVIGRRARGVAEHEALDYVFGYTCLNDVSARDLQFSDGQWVRGKSLDTFCPIGPWIVTADEISDPQRLAIACWLNGERVQDANTADMYFGVAELIACCSEAFSLEPGDIIATGTPPGVGAFRQPARFLRDDDELVVEIEAIGRLVNYCRPARSTRE